MQVCEIYIARSRYSSEDYAEFCHGLWEFSNRCYEKGGFTSDELPRELLISSHLSATWGQMAQNGVLGYFHNSILNSWEDSGHRSYFLKELADEGLGLIGADDHREIFRRIWALFEQNRFLLEELHGAGKFYAGGYLSPDISEDIRKQASDLESEWYGEKFDETQRVFFNKHRTWLNSLNNFHVLDPEEYEQKMETLCASNPLRQERLHELERLRIVELAKYNAFNKKQAQAKAAITRRAFNPTFFERMADRLSKYVRS